MRLFATPWTVARQAPLSMGFSRQEYWSGLPCLSPGDLPDPGIKPRSPALQADSLPFELAGNGWNFILPKSLKVIKRKQRKKLTTLVAAHKTRLIGKLGMFSMNLGSFYSQLLFWKPRLSVSFWHSGGTGYREHNDFLCFTRKLTPTAHHQPPVLRFCLILIKQAKTDKSVSFDISFVHNKNSKHIPRKSTDKCTANA